MIDFDPSENGVNAHSIRQLGSSVFCLHRTAFFLFFYLERFSNCEFCSANSSAAMSWRLAHGAMTPHDLLIEIWKDASRQKLAGHTFLLHNRHGVKKCVRRVLESQKRPTHLLTRCHFFPFSYSV